MLRFAQNIAHLRNSLALHCSALLSFFPSLSRRSFSASLLFGQLRAKGRRIAHRHFMVLGDDCWQYYSEGAANVVFQYVGNNPLFSCKLLRVRKSRIVQSISPKNNQPLSKLLTSLWMEHIARPLKSLPN